MRVPLLAGTRLLVVNAPDDAVLLSPPEPPPQAISDVGAAVRDALRFPLAGPQLAAVVGRGARATIVTDVPALPIPSAPVDARRSAIGAVVQELRRLGIPDARQTILVTAGLGRRPGRKELDRLFAPAFARAFHGRVRVHDVESPDLIDLADAGGMPLRIAPEIAEADVVVVVSAAETVLHGGPAVLLAAEERMRCGQPTPLLSSSLEDLAAGSSHSRSSVPSENGLRSRAFRSRWTYRESRTRPTATRTTRARENASDARMRLGCFTSCRARSGFGSCGRCRHR